MMYFIRKENTRFTVLCVALFVVLAVKNTFSLMKAIRRAQNNSKVISSSASVPRDVDPPLLRNGKEQVRFVLTPESPTEVDSPQKGGFETGPAAGANDEKPQQAVSAQKGHFEAGPAAGANDEQPRHAVSPQKSDFEAGPAAGANEEKPQHAVSASAQPPPPTKGNELEFVHITKTGGSAVEYVASLANVTWGLCHYQARPLAGPGCHNPDWKGFNARQKLGDQDIKWEHWHIPPRYFPEISPYQNKKLFAVVRNPYERFISEFYCPYTGWNKVDWTRADRPFDDPMGIPLEDALKNCKKCNNKPTKGPQVKKHETPNKLNEFLMERLQANVKWSAHYIPQFHYIYDEAGNKVVDHVLKHEHLQEEFTKLMAKYNLPVYLNQTVNQKKGKKEIRLTIRDLFPATVRRINSLYSDDFAKLGYEMIDPERLAEQRAREQAVQRIYYINLQKNIERRKSMEKWLSKQPIPFERINATIGSDNPKDCVPGKQHLDRCRGMSGLAKTELDIIRNHNTSGLTLVFEDDFVAWEPLDAVVSRTLRMVPSDWDIIRWDCWGGEIPEVFDNPLPGKVFRTFYTPKDRYSTGWFCGGTHAMLWREESISKLEQLWSQEPFDDVDCRLTTEKLNSYCVNIGIGGLKKVQGEKSDIPKIDA